MKLKLMQIINAKDSLVELSQKDLAVMASYRVAKILKKIDPEIAIYEDERIKLIRKYGEESEPGRLQVKQENIPEYVKELETLVQQEVDIDIQKVKISEIGNIDIKPAVLINLDFMIEE